MTLQTLPMTGTYDLDPESTAIRCHCKALFGAMTVRGTFRLISGRLIVGPDPAECAVSARIAADSYDSGLDTRDRDVRSANLLDVRAYPEISFGSSDVRPDGDGWLVTGAVVAHGTSVPAELRVREVRADGHQVRFEAVSVLDRTAFGITKMKGRVGRSVELFIDAVAVPA